MLRRRNHSYFRNCHQARQYPLRLRVGHQCNPCGNPLDSEAGSLGSWQRQKHSLSWSVNYRFQVLLRCFRMDDTTMSSPFQAIFTYRLRFTCTGCQVPTLSPVSSSEQRQYQEMLILVRITRFGWSISTTLLSVTGRAIADPSYVRCQTLHPGTVVEEA